MIDHAVEIFEKSAKEKGTCAAEDYSKAIKAIKHAKVDTTNDYILQKYNLCILNELCPNPSKSVFEKALADLNSVLIRRHEDSDSLLGLYDKVAALNFRSHKYNEAIMFINYALAIEKKHKKSDYNDDELHDQFKRRWRLALCLEYLGLNFIQEHQKGNGGIPFLEKAIRLLVGSNILSSVVSKSADNSNKENADNIDLIGLQESNNPLFMLASPEEEVITIGETEFSEPCLARTLEKWDKSDKHFKDGEYTELFHQLVAETEHILSHCLSEYVNYSSPKENDLFAIKLIRISDILMRRLGDGYITCLATLAIERKEYFKAIDMLSAKREAIKKSLRESFTQPYSFWHTIELCFSPQFSTQDGAETIKKDVEQVALIDFYIWYFSVLAGKTDYGIVKEEFHRYCSLSHDLNAKSYYSVINLKELLINGFTTLSGGKEPIDSQKNNDIITGIRRGFDLLSKSEPNQSIHFSIMREWDFLRIAYSVFTLYVTILKNPRNYDFRFYELAKKQNNSQNNPDIVVRNSRIRKEKIFYRAISNTGSFIFMGDIKLLKKIGKDCFGGFSLSPNTQMPSAYKKREWYRDVSNILVFVNNENRDKCISFIQDVITTDNRRRPAAQHTIYVDYSGLEDGEQLKKDIQNRTSNNIHIRYFDDQMQAFVLCALFTRIENILHTLYKPLNSYLISPIANDITYENQQDKTTQVLLKKSDLVGLNNWNVENGEWILNTCLPPKDRISFNGKVLYLEPFERTIPNLISVVKHLFCFSASARDDDDIVIKTNHFDIESHLSTNATEIYSDNIEIIDKKQNLRQALSSICQDATESQHFCHSGCLHDNCITLLTGAKLERYPALREYLFSYLGVKLDNYSYILLQERASSTNVYYSLCVLDETVDKITDNKRSQIISTICQSLEKNGIEKEGSCIKAIEKNKSTTEAETLQSLKRQIRPIERTKPYVFISYRANNAERRLCEPVYRDVIYLQKNYPEVGFYLDIANTGDSPKKEIPEVIMDDKCVGAIIYLSPDYITPQRTGKLDSTDEDPCFKEAKIIYQQKGTTKSGHQFFTFFVFPSSVLAETNYDVSLDAKAFVTEALICLQRESDATRIKLYRDLFECEEGLVSPRCTILTWERFGIHFESNVKGRGDNFQNKIRSLSES